MTLIVSKFVCAARQFYIQWTITIYLKRKLYSLLVSHEPWIMSLNLSWKFALCGDIRWTLIYLHLIDTLNIYIYMCIYRYMIYVPTLWYIGITIHVVHKVLEWMEIGKSKVLGHCMWHPSRPSCWVNLYPQRGSSLQANRMHLKEKDMNLPKKQFQVWNW